MEKKQKNVDCDKYRNHINEKALVNPGQPLIDSFQV